MATSIIDYNETNFINTIMYEYDGRNFIIDYAGYCTSLFEKHIDILIRNNIDTIDNIIEIYYTKKQIKNSKKFYKNNYIKTLLVPKLFSKFLDAIDKQNNLELSDAETEIYYSDDEINYYDDNFDD
jgi:ABC-type proline/glycine betaine transport system substrate-binding protein